jgi:hypothetical protein
MFTQVTKSGTFKRVFSEISFIADIRIEFCCIIELLIYIAFSFVMRLIGFCILVPLRSNWLFCNVMAFCQFLRLYTDQWDMAM